MSERVKIKGMVERVLFFKDSWGIIKCSIESYDGDDPEVIKGSEFAFKGNMPEPRVGNVYNIIAEAIMDDKWGKQFNIINIVAALEFGEEDDVGKKRFLQSIFTENQVNALYDALDDPFEVLKAKDTKKLILVKGVQNKTATTWITKFIHNLDKAKMFVELADYDLTTNMIDKLLDRYKTADLVIEKVKNNPYILCSEVKGIGWKKADAIAISGGIKENDSRRIEAFIIIYLRKKGEEGFSWITPDELMGAIIEELGEDIPDANITEAIHSLNDDNKLWWNDEKTKIGLKYYYDIEERLAEEIIRLRDAESDFKIDDWEKAVKELEEEQGWEYTDEQIAGVKLGLEHNVILIHGLAGTGKSSLVSAILRVLSNHKFVQTSLSGRAASRMSEITGEEGYTIHRLLGYPNGDPEYQKFEYNQDNQLEYEVYIIDEISMIEVNLLYFLFRAIPNGSRVIMLGDSGQLESIGAGNVAYDIINSDEIVSIKLNQIHRQAQKSAIITESIKVRKGEQIVEKDWVGEDIRGELQDLDIKCYSDSSNTFYEIIKRYTRCMAEKDFNVMECQVIVPIKQRGNANTYLLNNAIQDLYNPLEQQKENKVFGNGKPYILRVGDKVINRKNNYKTFPFIYNGNIGILKDFYNDCKEDKEFMIVDFYGIGEVKIEKKDWGSIELGYAITTHSYQGSQADTIIYGLDFSSYTLLTREQVYTAITRAKKKCYLIAQTGALRYAITKEGVTQKQTHLKENLHNISHPKLIF